MKADVIENLICCPVDRSYPLLVEQPTWEGDDLISGKLYCSTCEGRYDVIAGIAHLLPPTEVLAPEDAAAKRLEAETRDADAYIYDAHKTAYENSIGPSAITGAIKVSEGDVVLDLGAGTGRLTTVLATPGVTIVAIDLSPLSLEVNREKCAALPGATVHYIVADACNIPLRDGVMGKAVSAQMLEHISTNTQQQRCIKEIARVLRPGGRVVLTAYNYFWSKRRRGAREGFHAGGLYYYRFERGELHALFARAELRVRRLTGLLNLPSGLQARAIDRLLTAIPPIAGHTGQLLFAVAERQPE